MIISTLQTAFHYPIGTSKELFHYIDTWYDTHAHHKVVMLDEVQEIPQFEETIAALVETGGYDIYITGSNSHLLSGDLATLISGRYTTITIHSLSYTEFLQFHALSDDNSSLGLYLRYGGLPYLSNLSLSNEQSILSYFQTIEDTILLNDIVNAHKGSSTNFFRYLIRFLADSVGSPVSANSIARYLKNQHLQLSVPTVLSYLESVVRAFLVHRTEFMDISGKELLDISSKYYFEDIGIRNHLVNGFAPKDRAKIIENAVYLSLAQQGWTIRTGRMNNDKEIDFIATHGDKKVYVQVCEQFNSQKKIETEFGNLLVPRDAHPRYMITMDETLDGSSQDGIKVYSLRHWLRKTIPTK
jgi:predicted AAA+ superfamily ATPase